MSDPRRMRDGTRVAVGEETAMGTTPDGDRRELRDTVTALDRRGFLRHGLLLGATLVSGYGAAVLVKTPLDDESTSAKDAPHMSPRAVIAGEKEPGERLVITGTVYEPDGKRPAAGVVVYAYHTDAEGYYSRGLFNRRARLRGWMRTAADGHYEMSTIKPAPYPGRAIPAHIHMTVSRPGLPEYWLDDIWFEDDPLVTPEQRARRTGRGGFQPILKLTRGADGVLHGVRDIRLP